MRGKRFNQNIIYYFKNKFHPTDKMQQKPIIKIPKEHILEHSVFFFFISDKCGWDFYSSTGDKKEKQ